MPSIDSSLPCQVDGLLRIYTHTERNAFFEFENQDKLQKAKDAFTHCITNSPTLHLTSSITPKYANFALGISVDINTPINSAEELIRHVTEVITTETFLKRNVPIIPITMERLGSPKQVVII